MEGELQVRGCSVFDRYLGNDHGSANAFTADGWFRTGDLARIDTSGNVQLTGRLKELINRGGIIQSVDVEVIIDRHLGCPMRAGTHAGSDSRRARLLLRCVEE